MDSLRDGEFSVDAVVCLFAMFHVERGRHRGLLCRMRSCLRSDGLLLLTTGWTDWEGEEDFLGVPMRWSHFDCDTNRALLEDCGFTILFEDRHRGNPVGKKDTAHPIFLARV